MTAAPSDSATFDNDLNDRRHSWNPDSRGFVYIDRSYQ